MTVNKRIAHSASSTCVLDLWEQGLGQYESCATALARLIVSQPKRISALNNPDTVERRFRSSLNRSLARAKQSNAMFWLSAMSQFLHWQGRLADAVDLYRQTFDHFKNTRGYADSQTHAVAEELNRLLRRLGNDKEAWLIGHELLVTPLLALNDENSAIALRDAAYNAYASGYFAEAESIYRHLLTLNRDLIGTRCNLARILLVTGRDAEAMAEVNAAWESPPGGELYIVARILYLKALLAALAWTEYELPLAMLNEILAQNSAQACHPWLMTPVLDQVRSRLTPEVYSFFSNLAQELSNSTQ